MINKPIITACLLSAAIGAGGTPSNTRTNVTGYVVGTAKCVTQTVTESKTTQESVQLTIIELAELKPVPKAFSNRPNVWKRTGNEITLYGYNFTGKNGTLLTVTIVPTNALDGKLSYAVVDKPQKSSKK